MLKIEGKRNLLLQSLDWTYSVNFLLISDVDEKQFTKKCSKKYACSCAATEEGVQLQGDFFEAIKEILVMEYGIKKKYILDGQQYKHKFNEEMAKKKLAKKIKDGVIKEEENQDDAEEKKEPVVPAIA